MLLRINFIILLASCISCNYDLEKNQEISLLNQTIDQFNEAFKNVNIDQLDRLTTTNYTHVNGSNHPIDKKDWMNYLSKRRDQIKKEELVITTYAFNNRLITLYDNSAFVTGIVEVKGTSEGVEFSRKIQVSHFWVKEKEQWKRAGFHDSRIH